jgi:hypothetical protein
MNAERRLVEYCRWLQEPGINCLPGSGTLGRVRDEGPNAARRTDTQSDGGMGAMVDRMFYALQRDNRCKELADLILVMPLEHSATVQCTYIGHWRDVPRTGKAAAGILGVSMATYWRRKSSLLNWLTERLDIYDQRRAA